MTDTNQETIDCLNGLIQTCIDGEKGFRQAADALEDTPQVKQRFLTHAEERARFAQSLAIQVSALGGEPAEDGTFKGKIHRGWIDIRNAISSDDGAAIIAEAERGEDAAMSNYKDALETLPAGGPVRDMVETQYSSVRAAHAHVSALKATVNA